MKAGFPLFLIVVVVLGALDTPVHADLYDFTIQGTYDETLTAPDPTVPGGIRTLFTAGDAFTIQGTYDTDAQPVVETKGGDVTLADASFLGWQYDFSAITASIFTGMDLDLINHYYPSDPDVMNDDDEMNGEYTHHDSLVWPPLFGNAFAVDVYNDFTLLHVQETTTNAYTYPSVQYGCDAYIEYHYRTVMIPSGPFTTPKTVWSTIDLTIDSIEITDHVVPLPSSMVLLASAMATVGCLRKKLRRSAAGGEAS